MRNGRPRWLTQRAARQGSGREHPERFSDSSRSVRRARRPPGPAHHQRGLRFHRRPLGVLTWFVHPVHVATALPVAIIEPWLICTGADGPNLAAVVEGRLVDLPLVTGRACRHPRRPHISPISGAMWSADICTHRWGSARRAGRPPDPPTPPRCPVWPSHSFFCIPSPPSYASRHPMVRVQGVRRTIEHGRRRRTARWADEAQPRFPTLARGMAGRGHADHGPAGAAARCTS